MLLGQFLFLVPSGPGLIRNADDKNGFGTTISVSIIELFGNSLRFEGEAGPGPASG